MGLDDPTTSIDRSVPKSVHGIPNKMIIPNRIREASVRALLVLQPTMYDLVIEGSVREMGPPNKRMLRSVGGSRVSQSPLVTIDEFRAIRQAIMSEEGPFFPTRAVLVDLGLEEGAGIRTVGKRDGVVTRTIAVHGRGGWEVGGFG